MFNTSRIQNTNTYCTKPIGFQQFGLLRILGQALNRSLYLYSLSITAEELQQMTEAASNIVQQKPGKSSDVISDKEKKVELNTEEVQPTNNHAKIVQKEPILHQQQSQSPKNLNSSIREERKNQKQEQKPLDLKKAQEAKLIDQNDPSTNIVYLCMKKNSQNSKKQIEAQIAQIPQLEYHPRGLEQKLHNILTRETHDWSYLDKNKARELRELKKLL